MKNTIQVLFVSVNSGRSKKTGNDYDMRMAQCIVQKVNRKTGQVEPLVGELLLPEVYKDIAPGVYEVEFEVSISREKRIGSEVASMVLLSGGKAAVPAASSAAAPARSA